MPMSRTTASIPLKSSSLTPHCTSCEIQYPKNGKISDVRFQTTFASFLTKTFGFWCKAGIIKDISPNCSIPDDHIDPRRSALFLARSVLGGYLDGRHQYLFDVIAKRHRHQRYRQPFRRVMNLRGSWLNAMQPLRRLSGNGANATVLSIAAPHRLQTTLTTAQQAVAGMHCAKRDGCR